MFTLAHSAVISLCSLQHYVIPSNRVFCQRSRVSTSYVANQFTYNHIAFSAEDSLHGALLCLGLHHKQLSIKHSAQISKTQQQCNRSFWQNYLIGSSIKFDINRSSQCPYGSVYQVFFLAQDLIVIDWDIRWISVSVLQENAKSCFCGRKVGKLKH